jgi:hypothetical protein
LLKAYAILRPEDYMPMDTVLLTGSTKETINVTKKLSKSYYRTVIVKVPNYPLVGIALTLY